MGAGQYYVVSQNVVINELKKRWETIAHSGLLRNESTLRSRYGAHCSVQRSIKSPTMKVKLANQLPESNNPPECVMRYGERRWVKVEKGKSKGGY